MQVNAVWSPDKWASRRYLHLTELKLYELVADHQFLASKRSEKWLFPSADLDPWLLTGMARGDTGRVTVSSGLGCGLRS